MMVMNVYGCSLNYLKPYDEGQKTMGKSLETSTGVQRNSSCFFLEFCGLSIYALILPSVPPMWEDS